MTEKLRPIDLVKLGEHNNRPEITSERKAKGRVEYEKKKYEMVIKAILKHIEAVSYRGLRVGASVLADNPSVKGGFQVEASHNYKPRRLRQKGWDKLCAENNALTAVILDGADYISGIVVVSHHKVIGNDPEDKNHSEHALHSCQNCRNLYRELIQQGIMSEETMICFVNDDSLVYQDEGDLEELIGGPDLAPIKVMLPKLKLKKEITEQDVVNLPYEEMKMGEFLNIPEYQGDSPPIAGETPPPYTLV